MIAMKTKTKTNTTIKQCDGGEIGRTRMTVVAMNN
jgi:hypothetical protein